MEWSQRRKVFYIVGFFAFFALVAAYPVYRFTHPTPTCFDQKKNGDETGVDCGGACARMCAIDTRPLTVVWSKAFPVTGDTYDLAAYIENENTGAGLRALGYTLRAKDAQGKVLAERPGVIEVPPRSPILVFEGRVPFSERPESVEIEFSKDESATWVRARVVPLMFTTKNLVLKNADTSPRLYATLVNNDLVNDMPAIMLGAVVYDALRHPVAVSHTYTTPTVRGGDQDIFFTWPNRFTKNPRGGICPVPVDTMLVFDRSGSMNVGQKNPPEPLTTAKNAATAYLDTAETSDRVGVVSFATLPSTPIDQVLSFDHEAVRAAIATIGIDSSAIQHTNLGDALRSAWGEFAGVQSKEGAKRVIVALTDGVANRPLDPSGKTGVSYAEAYAVQIAQDLKTKGVEIYTIGLGKDINEEFLRDRIATNPAHYFNAPTADTLKDVYQKIAQGVCKPENFITEIVMTPRAVFE